MDGGPSQPQQAQTAIATKKRLYAKALDSLTSSSKVSIATSDSGSSLKRPATAAAALDEAIERASKRLRHSTSSTSIVPVTVPPKPATHKDDTSSKEPPNYAPWSHEAFLARLKTFSSVSIWHPKPEAINEVEWAKRGWVCTDVNTVRCKGGCERRVVIDLESIPRRPRTDKDEDDADTAEEDEDDQAAFEQALAERYRDVIVTGHAQSCLWRKGGCKDDIYHLQVVRPSVWQPELRNRYQSILEIQPAIEKVTLKPLEDTSSNLISAERLLKELPPDLFDDRDVELRDSASPKALQIALHGWRGTKESGTDLLRCNSCFQRIGLWMYQPDYRPSLTTSLDEETNDDITLDLVELHREHCPWRNATSQKASGSLAGLNACQILQRVVSTYAREHRRRSNEQTDPAVDGTNADDGSDVPSYSKEEVARQDKERESRLRKLKSLFSIKRRSTKTAPKPTAR